MVAFGEQDGTSYQRANEPGGAVSDESVGEHVVLPGAARLMLHRNAERSNPNWSAGSRITDQLTDALSQRLARLDTIFGDDRGPCAWSVYEPGVVHRLISAPTWHINRFPPYRIEPPTRKSRARAPGKKGGPREGGHPAGRARRSPPRRCPPPRIEEPNDAVVRITSTAICGSPMAHPVSGLRGHRRHLVPERLETGSATGVRTILALGVDVLSA